MGKTLEEELGPTSDWCTLETEMSAYYSGGQGSCTWLYRLHRRLYRSYYNQFF